MMTVEQIEAAFRATDRDRGAMRWRREHVGVLLREVERLRLKPLKPLTIEMHVQGVVNGAALSRMFPPAAKWPPATPGMIFRASQARFEAERRALAPSPTFWLGAEGAAP